MGVRGGHTGRGGEGAGRGGEGVRRDRAAGGADGCGRRRGRGSGAGAAVGGGGGGLGRRGVDRAAEHRVHAGEDGGGGGRGGGAGEGEDAVSYVSFFSCLLGGCDGVGWDC